MPELDRKNCQSGMDINLVLTGGRLALSEVHHSHSEPEACFTTAQKSAYLMHTRAPAIIPSQPHVQMIQVHMVHVVSL